jgi:predicted DNA-binding transcriptional regulator AlpA
MLFGVGACGRHAFRPPACEPQTDPDPAMGLSICVVQVQSNLSTANSRRSVLNTTHTATTKLKRTIVRPPLLPDTHAAALVEVTDICALLRVSKSWVYEKAADANHAFPRPVIREPRCTRWRLSAVLEYVNAITEKAALGTQAGEASHQRAKNASAAAQIVRSANRAARAAMIERAK